MIKQCLAFSLMPTLCLATCCLLEAPPEFPHTAPPRPPNVKSHLSCPAIKRNWPEYTRGDINIHFKDNEDFADVKHFNDRYNHTKTPISSDHIPSTSANPTVTDNKKSVSVGTVLGIVFGLVALFVLILLSWICTRTKPVKCDMAKHTDEGTNISFLHKCRMDPTNWKRPAVPSKMLRHLFKNPEKCDGLNSTASSESGYCEDIVDNQESTSPKTQIAMRNRQPRPSNSQLIPVTDTTPDIIASAQVNLEELPKRWSMFGLLPSLKPVLLAPMNQCELSDMDRGNDEDSRLFGSGADSRVRDCTPKKNSNDIVMKSIDGEHSKTPPSQKEHTRQTKVQPVDKSANTSSKPLKPKKSRVRIRSDGNQPEVEV